MSRWRAPAPKASPYITPEGHGRLKAEFDHLWRERRPEVVKALSAAAAEGDRSENAEYQYRKKELREIDRRLQYLTGRLEVLQVSDRPPSDPSRVYFGAWVSVEDERGDARSYRLVGADEVDATRAWISIDAPLARALLGKRVGDVVTVMLPGGRQVLEITGLRYDR